MLLLTWCRSLSALFSHIWVGYFQAFQVWPNFGWRPLDGYNLGFFLIVEAQQWLLASLLLFLLLSCSNAFAKSLRRAIVALLVVGNRYRALPDLPGFHESQFGWAGPPERCEITGRFRTVITHARTHEHTNRNRFEVKRLQPIG